MRSRGVHSQKFAEKRRKRRQALFFLSLLVIITVGASSILLLKASFLQIKSITVNGSTLAPAGAVSAAAMNALNSYYFHTIPTSNVLFYSSKAINQKLESNFKEIKDIKIHRTGVNSLDLNVVERTPAAVVCAGFQNDADPDECYLSDSNGYVFAPLASSTTGTTTQYDILDHYYVPTEQGTGTVAVGTNFISNGRFIELENFLKGAAKGGLVPLGILIGDNGQYEMYVKNQKGDSEVTVYFDDRSPFEKALENLLTFWGNEQSTSHGTTTPSFDYINLRFGNAVYYSTQ